jgi:hypothetical protein
VALQHLVETCPLEHVLTIPPRESFPSYPGNFVSEPTQPSTVAANAVVGEVALHQRRQTAVLVANRPVPVVPTPVVHCGHSADKAALGRDLPNHVLPRPSPDMGKAEKVEDAFLSSHIDPIMIDSALPEKPQKGEGNVPPSPIGLSNAGRTSQALRQLCRPVDAVQSRAPDRCRSRSTTPMPSCRVGQWSSI